MPIQGANFRQRLTAAFETNEETATVQSVDFHVTTQVWFACIAINLLAIALNVLNVALNVAAHELPPKRGASPGRYCAGAQGT